MIYISHRGNLIGPTPPSENKYYHVLYAIQRGFEVEVDVWFLDDKWYTGHDAPESEIKEEFLINHISSLWLHCKNKEALARFQRMWELFHFFWHQEDDYTLTSNNWVLSYPGKDACSGHSVCMVPERIMPVESIPEYLHKQGFAAVCSDYVETLKRLNTRP